MELKSQWVKIKENWLILLIFLVIILTLNNSTILDKSFSGVSRISGVGEIAYADSAIRIPSPGYGGDFVPDVEERKVTTFASMSTEVKRGDFEEAENSLKKLIEDNDGIIINENVYETGEKFKSQVGSFSVKIPVSNYEFFIKKLKEIGDVKSFNERVDDITGRYENTQIELDVERERLERYRNLYNQAVEIEDKISLDGRIFNQERRIKYLEDSLSNQDLRVDFTSVTITINEKRSDFVNITFVTIGDLVKSFVNSLNSLLQLIFRLIPYVIGIWLVLWLWKKYKKK